MPRFNAHLYDASGRLNANLLYDDYNRLYFGGRLPKVQVKWSRKKTVGCRGTCHYFPKLEIYLNPYLRGWETAWAGTLLHEMVHVEQRADVRCKDHGHKFQNRMKRLVTQGAFQDLW